MLGSLDIDSGYNTAEGTFKLSLDCATSNPTLSPVTANPTEVPTESPSKEVRKYSVLFLNHILCIVEDISVYSSIISTHPTCAIHIIHFTADQGPKSLALKKRK